MKISLKLFLLGCALIFSSLVPYALAGAVKKGGVAGIAAKVASKGAKALKGKKKDAECKKFKFPNNRKFSQCGDLTLLKAFLHFNYDKNSHKFEMALRQQGADSSNWVAFAINPTAAGMVGAQAIVGHNDEKGVFRAYTSPISDHSTKLEEGPLSFPVTNLGGEVTKNETLLFATITLPENTTNKVNIVWQRGPMNGNQPASHPTNGDNLKAFGELDLDGKNSGTDRSMKVHGGLYALSWGLLCLIWALF